MIWLALSAFGFILTIIGNHVACDSAQAGFFIWLIGVIFTVWGIGFWWLEWQLDRARAQHIKELHGLYKD